MATRPERNQQDWMLLTSSCEDAVTWVIQVLLSGVLLLTVEDTVDLVAKR